MYTYYTCIYAYIYFCTATILASPETRVTMWHDPWQAEIERLEIALTSKMSADVWVLVTAFLAKPRGLIDKVLEAMIE